jgi:hypothetical protein
VKLTDYNGPLRANLRLEHFSKEALIRLIRLYSRLYFALDGFWYLSVKERFTDKDAVACDMWTWGKQRTYELDRLTKAMKIQGTDVTALIKAFQLDPWMWSANYLVEVKNSNHVLLTFVECPTLLGLEREGKGREEVICRVVEQEVFESWAHYFNPSIQVKGLKLPPRTSKDEIACRWEFKNEEETEGRGGDS